MAKKQREPSPSSSSASEAEDVQMTTGSASPEGSKKRKRVAQEGDELEIDVSLPEPQSKKALREAKKAAKRAKKNPEATAGEDGAVKTETVSQATGENAGKRSDYGIWIGNLPFTADKDIVRIFFTRQGQIPEAEITRLHMPVPTHAQPGRPKPNNKGFAYVDFSTAESLKKAIDLSESLMTGRKVLIKDAKSYEGRPQIATPGPTANALAGVVEAPVATADGAKPAARASGHEPSKRVFVGNLGFDVTKEDLEYHFGQAGEIEDIHMATFQDTGKCKGFAWVRFVELEAAQGAVNGFVFKEEPASDDDESAAESASEPDSDSDADSDADTKPQKTKKAKKSKKPKKRKWFINRLQGRPLRCEFAEDASTRYKKRFGKGGDKNGDEGSSAPITDAGADDAPRQKVRPKGDKDARQEQRRQKHIDARKIRPGAALANAPRGASGAIVASQGKKVTFD